jgi:hypothetical protein
MKSDLFVCEHQPIYIHIDVTRRPRNGFHIAYHLARILKLDSRHRVCRIVLAEILSLILALAFWHMNSSA